MAVITVEVNGGSALVNCVPDSVLPTTIDPPGFSSSPKTISVPEVPGVGVLLAKTSMPLSFWPKCEFPKLTTVGLSGLP